MQRLSAPLHGKESRAVTQRLGGVVGGEGGLSQKLREGP